MPHWQLAPFHTPAALGHQQLATLFHHKPTLTIICGAASGSRHDTCACLDDVEAIHSIADDKAALTQGELAFGIHTEACTAAASAAAASPSCKLGTLAEVGPEPVMIASCNTIIACLQNAASCS
jgi:hypothetical protein